MIYMRKLDEYMVSDGDHGDYHRLQEATLYYKHSGALFRVTLADKSDWPYADSLIVPRSDRTYIATGAIHFRKSRLDDVRKVEALRWRITEKLAALADDWDNAVAMIKAADNGCGYHKSEKGNLLKYSIAPSGGVYFGSGDVKLPAGASALEHLASTASPTPEQFAAGAAYALTSSRSDKYCRYLYRADSALFAAIQRRGLLEDFSGGYVVKINGRVYPCIPSPSYQDPRFNKPLTPHDLRDLWPRPDSEPVRIIEL